MNSFDLLMKKADQKANAKPKVFRYKSKALGGEITLVRPDSPKHYTDMMDAIDKAETNSELLIVFGEMIYWCLPELKGKIKELGEAFGTSDPGTIVFKAFEDNLSELSEITQEIAANFYGVEIEAENVKNS